MTYVHRFYKYEESVLISICSHTGLFNKAKKKILKEDRDEEVGAVPYVSDKPISNAAKVSGIDPTLWEPQRLGEYRCLCNSQYFGSVCM